DHRDVRNLRDGSFKHLPGICGPGDIASAVLRDQLVDDGSIRWTPRRVPDVVEPNRKRWHLEPPRAGKTGGQSLRVDPSEPAESPLRTSRPCRPPPPLARQPGHLLG